MNYCLSIQLAFFLTALFLMVHSEPMKRCRKRRFPYKIPDSEQCDKFYLCTKGELKEDLCPDGLVYEIESQGCFMPQRVQCKRRTKLQEPTGNEDCPRKNGRFPIDEECSVYNECSDGVPTKVDCPLDLVYDIEQAVCEFPDIANRTGCSAEDILGFRCPHGSNVKSDDVVLQFGDHERLPNKDDCRWFFMCLKSGLPRRTGCPYGQVFNPATFFCDKPGNVPGCESYYTNRS